MSNYEINLKVSGGILKELSKNIPSTKFALLELIKNSYEAGAKKVRVVLSNEYLIVEDDGCGISQNDISALLKISYSNKKFGQKTHGRIVSGEKGLGFYSAFKFGNRIVVETTCNDIKSSFQLIYSDIEKCENISDYKIPITIESNPHVNGTTIKILDINKESLVFLKNTLLDPANKKKIEKAIVPNKENDEFEIEIILKDMDTGKKEKYKDPSPYRIANLVYKNKKDTQEINNVIDINIDDDEIQNIKIIIPNDFLPLITNPYIEFDINIEYFNFRKIKPNIKTENIDPLFFDVTSNRITPLVYINNALFDNYQLYNVEINSSVQSSKVIRQQTGFIHILITNDHVIDFNSDRTAINESETQILLKRFLDFISSESQIKIKGAKKTKKSKSTYEFYKNDESLCLEKLIDDKPLHIKHNGKKVEEFNKTIVGVWEIETENKTLEIIILDYCRPSIYQREHSCETFKKYNIDEFFDFYNSKGQKNDNIEPNMSLEESEKTSIKFNQRNGDITFLHPGTYRLTISLRDKISDLSYKSTYMIVANDKNHEINKGYTNNTNNKFLSLLINPNNETKLKGDIRCFIEEVNEISILNTYDNVFASSIRTLVELVVCDIEDIHNSSLNDLQTIYITESSLSRRYEKVMKIIINTFPDLISKDCKNIDRKKIQGIINSIKENYMANGLVAFLNLSTHQGTRLVDRKDIELRKLVFCLLITYLNEISINDEKV